MEEVSLIFFKKAFNNCKYIYTQEVINESLTIPLTHCVLQAMNHVLHVYESRVKVKLVNIFTAIKMKSKTTVYKSFLNLPEVIDTLICVLQDGYPNEATKQRGIKCGYLDKQTRYKMACM